MIRRARCLLWFAAALLAHAETLDRIAVTVGTFVISEHDILQNIRIAAFIDEKTPDFSGMQRRQAADRLIDQYLVLQDAAATHATLASPADVAALATPIRARYKDEAAYRAALAQAGLTVDELNNHLLAGLRMLRYTDLRFRPEVQLSDDALRAFYDKLKAQAAGKLPAGDSPGSLKSFEDSRGQIEKLLADQQVMDSLDRWLTMERSETRIVYRDSVFEDVVSKKAAPQGGVSP